jgi:hypothetical protein
METVERTTQNLKKCICKNVQAIHSYARFKQHPILCILLSAAWKTPTIWKACFVLLAPVIALKKEMAACVGSATSSTNINYPNTIIVFLKTKITEEFILNLFHHPSIIRLESVLSVIKPRTIKVAWLNLFLLINYLIT